MKRRDNTTIQISHFSLGTLVTVNASFLNEPAGVLAFVYEVYDRPGLSGISVITENGVDLGGFSIDEQDKYLKYYGDTGQVYNFKNVIQLDMDWSRGLFKPFFEHREKYKRELKTNRHG